jgi:MYXO-CTERM domain-containing protein
VGELVIRSGHEALAQRIDQRFHTEYVPNMADAELVGWAVQHGFSLAELAQIQPTYCNCDGWNGGFGPEDAVGGAAGAPNGADYFQPVCASNGLTYWNECVATMCGGVTVIAAGQCEQEPPCELCGTGTRSAVVAECEEQGICNGIDSQPQVVPVNEAVATRWLELQQTRCESPNYTFEGDPKWVPAYRVRESWSCDNLSGQGGAAGQPSAAGGRAPNESSSGGVRSDDETEAGASGEPGAPNESEPSTDASCDCRAAAPRHGHTAIAGLMLGLVALARRRKHSMR